MVSYFSYTLSVCLSHLPLSFSFSQILFLSHPTFLISCLLPNSLNRFCICNSHLFFKCGLYIFFSINNINEDPDRFGYQRLILIMLKEMSIDYDKRIDFLKTDMHEKYNVKLIFFFEKSIESKTYLEILFRKLWKRQFLNVIVLYRAGSLIQLASYNPFDTSFIHIISFIDILRHGIFYDKTVQLYGTSLNVSLFPEDARVERAFIGLTGPDAEFSKLVSRTINATFVPSNDTEFGEFDEFGVPAGSLASLINRKIDISFNLRVFRIEDFKDKVEVTHVNGRSELCFLVPHVSSQSKFGNLFKSFDYILWVLMAVTVAISTLVWMLLSVLSGEPVMGLTTTLLNLFSASMANPLLIFPRRLPLRILAIFFLFYGVFISNAFKCNLTSILLESTNGTQLNTITQLAYTNYPIYILERYRPLLEDNLDPTNSTHVRILKRLQTVNDTVYKQLIKSNSEVGFVNKKHLTSYYAHERKHLSLGVPVYHEMNECPVPILQTYAVPMGSPYLGRIDLILRRAQEAGLTNLWENKIRNGIGKSDKKSALSSDDDSKQPLGMEHLQACFTLLSIGKMIGLMVFCYEVWMSRKKQNKARARNNISFEMN